MSVDLQSAPSTQPSAPAPTPSAAPSAPAKSSQGPTPSAQGATKPPAPSQPDTAVDSSTKPSRRERSKDAMRQALQTAQKASESNPELTQALGGEPKPDAPGAQPSAQDAAKAALSTTKAPAAQPAPQAAPDPQMTELMALRRTTSDQGRRFQQMQQEVQQLRQFREEQVRHAETAKIKPYMSTHPDNAATMARINRADSFDAALSALPAEVQANPQVRAAMAQKMGVTNEDMALRNEWKTHKDTVAQQMAADPDAFIQKRAEQIAEQKFNELFERRSQEQAIQQEIQTHLQDPVAQKYLREHPQEFRQAVNDMGGRTDYAVHLAQIHEANQRLLGEVEARDRRIQELEGVSGMAAEQQRLLKSRATHTREVAPQIVSDPLKAARRWAKENDVPPQMSHPKFAAKVNELYQQRGKTPNA